MRKLFDLLVRFKEMIGFCLNWPKFLFWRVKYKSFPKTRGRIFICNYGKIQMGKNVYINSNLESNQLGFYPRTILHTSRGAQIIIEDNAGMSNVALFARKSIKVGKYVKLGAGVKVYDNDFHELGHGVIEGRAEEIPAEEVVIGDNAFVGAGSIVLKGVHIGKNAIVGAGSVVTKDIPDGEVWAGNPAKRIK